jgi:hypothetical protein
MRIVTANARAQARGKTPAELRAMAEHADYMATRVYGKVAESDDDVRRIEATEHRAKVWAALADEIETVTFLAGEAAADWPLLGIACRPADNATGPALEILAEARDGEYDLVGLWPLDGAGKPTGPYQIVLRLRPDGTAHTVPTPDGTAPRHPADTAATERARWLGVSPDSLR